MRFVALSLAVTLCLIGGALSQHTAEDHHKGHKHLTRHESLRSTRHIHTNFEDFAAEHLSWLSDDEKAEVKKLHGESKEKAREKVLEILEASTGEKKTKGQALLQAACKELAVSVLGEDGAKELKTMKESGSTSEELSKKFVTLLEKVTDEQKKAKAIEHKDVCEKIYNLKTSSKKRRDAAHHHDLEAKLRSEWNWLTNDQKEEIRKLKNDGKNDEFLLTKVFEYFKNADDKSAAEDGLQTSCGNAVLTILGPEKAEELKTFMANGAKPDAYEAKVKELLSSAPKKTLTKNQESCKLVFTSASRRRRHEGHHHKTLEDYLQSHLSWLTDSQKEEVRQLKKDGKDSKEIQAKVMEFYESATGEVKEKATTDLKSGCEEVLAHLLTKEQLDEVKKLRESGSTPNDVSAKIQEFVKTITDEEKLTEARKYKENCKKIFGVTDRRRRHDGHHHHTLENYLESSHLSWLTEPQKESLKKLSQEGKAKEVIQKQVLDYYEATQGEIRTKATAALQAGCQELFTHLIGEEKVSELKKLGESGSTNEELRDKGLEFINALEDPKKKEEAKFYGVGCLKVSELKSKSKRHIHKHQDGRYKRHDHKEHSLEELFKSYLSWLTEDQQKKLLELKAEGKTRDELQKQVLEYYESATGDVKENAKQKMQDGCRSLLVKVLGEEKATELKKLKESGSTIKEISDKTKEWINELTDENAKKSAQEYSVVCSKAFSIE